jgi:putative endonuclease
MKQEQNREAGGRAVKGCYVYTVVANDGSLYTGISGDPEHRVSEHNAGTGAKALRGRRPVRLLWCAVCESRSAALRLEAKIKKLRASEKWSIVLSNTSDSDHHGHGVRAYSLGRTGEDIVGLAAHDRRLIAACPATVASFSRIRS